MSFEAAPTVSNSAPQYEIKNDLIPEAAVEVAAKHFSKCVTDSFPFSHVCACLTLCLGPIYSLYEGAHLNNVHPYGFRPSLGDSQRSAASSENLLDWQQDNSCRKRSA